MKQLKPSYKIALLLLLVLLCFSVAKASAQYSADELNCIQKNGAAKIDKNKCLEQGLSQAIGWDQDCKTYLSQYKDSKKYTIRDVIDDVPGGEPTGTVVELAMLITYGCLLRVHLLLKALPLLLLDKKQRSHK